MEFIKNNALRIFFAVFIVAYAGLILIKTDFAPTDDFIFLRTLQAGKFLNYYSADFPYYNSLKMGRFTPLVATEYNIYHFFSDSPAPFWYYFSHAVQFIILALILAALLKKVTTNKWLIYGIPILFALVPGFAVSHFRLQMNERNEVFFFAAFLLCYLTYLEKRRWFYAILSFIFATIAVYYKETAFIALGTFAASHLILSWSAKDKKIKVLDWTLLASALSYIAIYVFYILPQKMPFPSQTEQILLQQKLINFIKDIFNYTLFSDPIIILTLLVFGWRLYKVFIKKETAQPEYDSMIAAGAAYALTFLIPLNWLMNMYGTNYMLPVYIFSFSPLIYFLAQSRPLTNFWKASLALVLFIFFFNAAPAGIHHIAFYKYFPINSNQTLNFLVQDINSRHPHERANIFLDGVGRSDSDRASHYVFAEFLRYKGLNTQRFDMKSNTETETPGTWPTNDETLTFIKSFSVFQKDTTDQIKSGDYLIVSPTMHIEITPRYLASFQKDYTLLFQTSSPFFVPNFHLKAAAKYLASKFLPASAGLVKSANISEQADYYVFIKK